MLGQNNMKGPLFHRSSLNETFSNVRNGTHTSSGLDLNNQTVHSNPNLHKSQVIQVQQIRPAAHFSTDLYHSDNETDGKQREKPRGRPTNPRRGRGRKTAGALDPEPSTTKPAAFDRRYHGGRAGL